MRPNLAIAFFGVAESRYEFTIHGYDQTLTRRSNATSLLQKCMHT
ncbi:hypothetical protein [Fischerella thermalis]|nr:hypothetical protein [Fischerella thermalis]